MEAKPWWSSKLMWLAFVEAIFGIYELAKDGTITADDWQAGMVLVAAAATAVFRAVTNQPVANRVLAWLLACFLVFQSGNSMAGETAVVIDDSKPGTYLVTVGADGSVSVNPIKVVRAGGIPSPPTNPTPTDPSPTPFSKSIQGLTKAALDAGATPTTAAALSSVYSLVSSGVKDGSIPEANALSAIKTATDTVMLNVADKAKWDKWRTDLGVALETLRQQGVLKIPSALDEVSRGIDLALGHSIDPKQIVGMTKAQQGAAIVSDKLFENIDLTKLIELIKLIVELLKIFRPM